MRKGDHLSNQLVIILMLDIIFELDSMVEIMKLESKARAN